MVKNILTAAALGLAALAGIAVPAKAETTTFHFRGTCGDCTGYGNGELVVQNYTLGSQFDPSEFVSFSYQSNLIAGSPFISAPVTDFSGSIGASPGRYDVFFQTAYDANDPNSYKVFFSNANPGDWCIGVGISCAFDIGPDHVWSLAPLSTPEPLSVSLLGVGVVGALFGSRRGKSGARG